MGKYDVTHKTGNTQQIATPTEKKLTTTTGNISRKFGEVWACGS